MLPPDSLKQRLPGAQSSKPLAPHFDPHARRRLGQLVDQARKPRAAP
jgi:hypothetical protein